MSEPLQIRPAAEVDLDQLAQMAGELVRYHHAVDPLRFLLVDEVEKGYRWFFDKQRTIRETVLLVALRGERRVGYAYAGLEPRDWNALLDACGALHDIFVAPEERHRGVASALIEAVAQSLRALGAPRLVLGTAVQNVAAQRLFERHGFRRTMLEMTREL